MTTLLQGLHFVAVQRGDGLRPELLRLLTPSTAYSAVEEMRKVLNSEDTDGAPADKAKPDIQSAETVAISRCKRG